MFGVGVIHSALQEKPLNFYVGMSQFVYMLTPGLASMEFFVMVSNLLPGIFICEPHRAHSRPKRAIWPDAFVGWLAGQRVDFIALAM
jgi:hypothetical protein